MKYPIIYLSDAVALKRLARDCWDAGITLDGAPNRPFDDMWRMHQDVSLWPYLAIFIRDGTVTTCHADWARDRLKEGSHTLVNSPAQFLSYAKRVMATRAAQPNV